MKNSQRLHYIDIIKGIGIFLVVLGHVYRDNVVQNWLYSFHMPLFFMVSGWLFNYEKIKSVSFLEITKKKIRALMVPYVVFCSICFLYWCVLERYFRDFDQGPLWFLPVLLMIELISAVLIPIVIKKNIRNTMTAIVTLFFIACSTYITRDNILCVWLLRIITGFFWYYYGWYFSNLIRNRLESNIEYKRLMVGTVFLLGSSVCLGCLNGRVDIFLARFNNIALYIICGITGTGLCLGIALILKRNKLFEFLGKYSLLIMCTHEPIKRVVIKVIGVLTKIDTDTIRNSIISGMIIAVLVILLEIVFIWIWRYMNKISANKWYNFLFEMAKV